MRTPRPSRRRAALIVGVVAAASAAAISLASLAIGGEFPSRPDEQMSNQLSLTAGKVVATIGDKGSSKPTKADVVLASRDAAADLFSPGTKLFLEDQVYAVQMNGDFVANVSVPFGEELPTGTAMWFCVDPATGEITDWGVRPEPADLSKLGEVTSIPVTYDGEESPSASAQP